MSEAFLKRAVKKHFRALGYTVRIRRIRLGNAKIDGEALGVDGQRVAIKVKALSKVLKAQTIVINIEESLIRH